jgi:hypothetical protein
MWQSDHFSLFDSLGIDAQLCLNYCPSRGNSIHFQLTGFPQPEGFPVEINALMNPNGQKLIGKMKD